jgi:O-antigen/teichoic acid export membrane protein
MSSLPLAAVASMINRGVQIIGPLILIPLYVRYLTLDQYGVWIAASAVVGYLGLLNFGMPQTLGVHIARTGTGNQKEVQEIFSTTIFVLIGIAILAALVGAALIYLIFPSHWSNETKFVLAVTGLGFLASLPLQSYSVALRFRHRILEEQVFNTIGTTFRCAVIAGLLISGAGLYAVVSAHAVSLLISPALSFWRLRKVAPTLKAELKNVRASLVSSILRPSLAFLVLGVSYQLAFGADSVVIAGSIGPSAVPSYAIPMQVVFACLSFVGVITFSVGPRLALHGRADGSPQFRALYMRTLSICSAAGALFAIALLGAGIDAIHIWTGRTLELSSVTFVLMIAFLLLQSILLPPDAMLVNTLQHQQYAVMALIEAVLNVALSIWWVSIFGVAGVIAATVVARLFTNAWFLVRVANRAAGVTTGVFLQILLCCLLAPLVLGLVVEFGVRIADDATERLIRACIGVGVAAIAAWIFGLRQQVVRTTSV